MDSVTASYAGVAGSSPTEKEQKFVPFSFIHNPPYLYLIGVDVVEERMGFISWVVPNTKDVVHVSPPSSNEVGGWVCGKRLRFESVKKMIHSRQAWRE